MSKYKPIKDINQINIGDTVYTSGHNYVPYKVWAVIPEQNSVVIGAGTQPNPTLDWRRNVKDLFVKKV